MNETFKPIPGYDRYFATESGEIWSAWKNRLKQVASRPHYRSGYLMVTVRVDKKRSVPYVHKLVLLAFVGPRPEGYEARHKNGIKTDNRLDNLCWGTPEENTKDREGHGTILRGSACPAARLTPESVQEIRQRLAAGISLRALAREYGVVNSTICKIKLGRTWGHLAPQEKR